MPDRIWVLGATGRVGRAVGARLDAAGLPLVLAGRDGERLQGVAAGLAGTPRLLAGSLDEALTALAEAPPAVVINTVGPFITTAVKVARACPPGSHYVDMANELDAVQAILDLDAHARVARSTLVSAAGFGVLATESVVLRLCADEPPAKRVRVDAVASVASEPGVIGPALAASIIGGLPAGGREVRHGRVVRSRLLAQPQRLTTPEGDTVNSASVPTGELLAAWRASGADSVLAASALVPTGTTARLIMPIAATILRIPAVRDIATARLARVRTPARPAPRQFSWAHGYVEWQSGAVREGWLRAGDGMDFTASATAQVAQRLAHGEGRPGAYTPAALFGPELALAAGGEFVTDHKNRDRHPS